MHIRVATSLDRADILSTYLAAFPDSEKDIVARLAVDLLTESSIPETLSLVAEIDNTVVGHVAFSPVSIDNNENLQGYILAPLAVMPGYQGQRIGSKLIASGIQTLVEMGVSILFVYGDPGYYGRFGFSAGHAEKLMPQYKLRYPFGWQAMVLNRFSMDKIAGNIVCVASLDDPELW